MTLRSAVLGAAIALSILGCSPAPTAASVYLAAVSPGNQLRDQMPNGQTATLDEWHLWANKIIASNQTFVKALQGMTVDARTADDIHALIAATAAEQAAAAAIVSATTLSDVHRIVLLWPRSNAADLVRLDLGLPPVGASPS